MGQGRATKDYIGELALSIEDWFPDGSYDFDENKLVRSAFIHGIPMLSTHFILYSLWRLIFTHLGRKLQHKAPFKSDLDSSEPLLPTR